MRVSGRSASAWAVAAALAALCFAASPARAATVSIACGGVGKELEICRELSEAWAKKAGNEVKIVSTPNSATERLALYQQLLAAGSPDVDVFEIDTIWPGILGTHFIDLAPYSRGAEKDFFPAVIGNDTREGKLVAMPIYTEGGLIFFRKDLLDKYGEKVPATWDELTATARKVEEGERKAGQGGMWGIVFQGKAYEGLTCDALEWVASYGGGTIVAPDGKVTIDNPQAAAALDMAGNWMRDLAPQGVLNEQLGEASYLYLESPVRDGFVILRQEGDTAVAAGDAVVARLPEEHCHLFGPDGRAVPRHLPANPAATPRLAPAMA